MATAGVLFAPRRAAARNNLRRRRRRRDRRRRLVVAEGEFCGQCTWQGNVLCEARAQYLVKQGDGGVKLQEARDSLMDYCSADVVVVEKRVPFPLEAFCGRCAWPPSVNISCDQRVMYLMENYDYPETEEEAQEALLEKGECVDPDYVPPPPAKEDEEPESAGMSNGAIIGIAIGILAVVMGLVGLIARRRYMREKAEREARRKAKKEARKEAERRSAREMAVSHDVANSGEPKNAKDRTPESTPAAVPPPVVPTITKRGKSRKSKSRSRSSRKSITFGLDKPDPDGATNYVRPDEWATTTVAPNEEGPSSTAPDVGAAENPETEESTEPAAAGPKDGIGADAAAGPDDTTSANAEGRGNESQQTIAAPGILRKGKFTAGFVPSNEADSGASVDSAMPQETPGDASSEGAEENAVDVEDDDSEKGGSSENDALNEEEIAMDEAEELLPEEEMKTPLDP